MSSMGTEWLGITRKAPCACIWLQMHVLELVADKTQAQENLVCVPWNNCTLGVAGLPCDQRLLIACHLQCMHLRNWWLVTVVCSGSIAVSSLH